jgi:hypothetical protein
MLQVSQARAQVRVQPLALQPASQQWARVLVKRQVQRV